jgi:hypothetical protein
VPVGLERHRWLRPARRPICNPSSWRLCWDRRTAHKLKPELRWRETAPTARRTLPVPSWQECGRRRCPRKPATRYPSNRAPESLKVLSRIAPARRQAVRSGLLREGEPEIAAGQIRLRPGMRSVRLSIMAAAPGRVRLLRSGCGERAIWSTELRDSARLRDAGRSASGCPGVRVRDQIDAFINADNQTAHPFAWTKQVVFSQHPRAKYADLCN